MDNVQKVNSFIDIPSSQTFRSYLQHFYNYIIVYQDGI
jgi:hypothetical protein